MSQARLFLKCKLLLAALASFAFLPCHLIHSSERDEGARIFGRNPGFDSTLGGYKCCILWKQRVKLVAADGMAGLVR